MGNWGRFRYLNTVYKMEIHTAVYDEEAEQARFRVSREAGHRKPVQQ